MTYPSLPLGPWGSELRVVVFASAHEVASAAADLFQSASSEDAFFGFATGNTPLRIYEELQRRGGLPCKAAFSLDEYIGLEPSDRRSFAWYVRNRIEPALGYAAGFVHVPSGVAADNDAECNRFENLVQQFPIDLQLLGTGRNGHIAFNEPGSPSFSQTRVVELDSSTREDNGLDFGGLAPQWAITQGVATIARAKQILLVATGAGKKQALAQLLEGKEDSQWPLTHLKDHSNLVVLADQAAVD